MTAMNNVSKYLSKKVYQYELQTALYMLEPWEKILFSKRAKIMKLKVMTLTFSSLDSLALCLLSLSIATVYHFTPTMFTSQEI